MGSITRRHLAPFMLASLLVAAGCGDDSPQKPREQAGDLAPDFALADVNPNSATLDSTLSPRDFLGKVSAWYFGQAT